MKDYRSWYTKMLDDAEFIQNELQKCYDHSDLFIETSAGDSTSSDDEFFCLAEQYWAIREGLA